MGSHAKGTRNRPDSPYIGREWELGQLRRGLSEALAGRGQLYVVSGEAGIGKTRLALQLAGIAEQEHLRVLWGRCWEGEESPAFWPWIQIFRTLALISGGHPGGPASPRPGTHGPQFSGDTATTGGAHKLRHLTPELSGLVALDAGALAHPSDQERFRLFDAATAFISQTAADRPLVLILDDIHAADRSSLLLLDFVAQHLQTIPVLVVGTFREPEGDTDALVADLLGRLVRRGHRIPLLGLRPEETAELLARGFGITAAPDLLTALQDGTGGNPFFLDEVARRFVSEGRIHEAPGGGVEVPEGLRESIRSRLGRLPAEARSLLELAAVIGREFSFSLLVASSGLARETVLDLLADLAARRFVDPAGFGLGPYRFARSSSSTVSSRPPRRRSPSRRVRRSHAGSCWPSARTLPRASPRSPAGSTWHVRASSMSPTCSYATGLCLSEDNPRHRRAKLLALTATGRRALARIEAAQHEWANALGERIGEATLREAGGALGRGLEEIERT